MSKKPLNLIITTAGVGLECCVDFKPEEVMVYHTPQTILALLERNTQIKAQFAHAVAIQENRRNRKREPTRHEQEG
jgi:hypothetical protein